MGMYLTFVFVHTLNEQLKLVVWLFRIVALVNIILIPWLVVLIILSISTGAIKILPPLPDKRSDAIATILVWFSLANMFGPFLLTFLHGVTEPWYMIKSSFEFYLFLPTMVGYFPAYSFSRLWDLTWGNRPSDTLSSLANTKSKQQQQQTQANIRSTARFVCWTIVGLNVLLVTLLANVENTTEVFLWLAVVVFSSALLQMVFSGIWLICLIIFGRLPHYMYRGFCGVSYEDYLQDVASNFQQRQEKAAARGEPIRGVEQKAF